MPSKKTRINLTVDAELNQLLDDVSRLTNMPKATLILNIINDVSPMLIELRDALDVVNEKQGFLSGLARMSALANAKTAVINQEMAELYKDSSK